MNLIFELTNEQRKYLGLIPVEGNWELVKFDNNIYHYFEGDNIKKEITVSENYYHESELNEKTTENRTMILPKTKRGKIKKFNYTAVQSFSPFGTYFTFSTNQVIIANYTTQRTYYSESFTESENITIDDLKKWLNKWIEETISGAKNVEDRKLGKLLKRMKKGDILICSELSRLGRNLLMIMGILNECMNKDIQVWTIKDNYRLGSDINSKVLAFAFGLSAEIERNLISQRTKEALARKRAEGVVLGRPKGKKSSKTKLTGQEQKIKELLDKKVSYSAIGRILGVHRLTVSAFVKSKINH